MRRKARSARRFARHIVVLAGVRAVLALLPASSLMFSVLGEKLETPGPDRIKSLIADLERECGMPPTPWGGAVQERSLAALQAAHERAERDARRRAIKELQNIGKPSVPLLIEALKTSTGAKAEALAKVLGAVGGPEAVYPLLRLADDPSQILRARLAAAVAVTRQGNTTQCPLLLAGLYLSGEGLLLADALAGASFLADELNRARLQWLRECRQEEFLAARTALHSLAPKASPSSVPESDIWGTIVAWDKWWTRSRPFQKVEVLADDPWQNRFWYQRTLGALAEYGPLIGEMRRLFLEARLRDLAERPPRSVAQALAELQSMGYGAEPFPVGSGEAARFSLSGYVRSGMLIHEYGYGRKTGAWLLLRKMYVGVDGWPRGLQERSIQREIVPDQNIPR